MPQPEPGGWLALSLILGVLGRCIPGTLEYPNGDIAVHILRAPRSDWTGFSTRTGFAATGIGLNAATLFDDHGVVGTVAQTLTLRPR